MNKLVPALSAAFALVVIAATLAILSDAGGAESAGPVPSALVLETRPGEPDVPEVDYVIDLNTGVMTPLPEAIIRSVAKAGESGLEAYPYWHAPRYAVSPDGSMLAYVGTGEGEILQIFIARVDGTGIRQVTNDRTGATLPAWSPDGTRIAYQGYERGDVRNFFVLDVATGWPTRVSDAGPVAPWSQPQFTPDGSSLVYGGKDGIRTVPVAGGESELLIGAGEGVTDAGDGSLSPDGSLVTFLGSGTPDEGPGHCGPCRFVANADGTGRRVIPGWISSPAGTWSPDGSRIVSLGADNEDIVVVDIATGEASLVAKGNAASWLDTDTLLVEVVAAGNRAQTFG